MANFILLRTMEEEFLESLLNKGEMLFKPSKFFRELESSDPRMDQNDNKPQTKEVVKKGGPVKLGNKIVAEFGMQIGGLENIYCFTAVDESNYKEFLATNSISKFGDSVLIIKDSQAFIAQLSNANKRMKSDRVAYLPREEIEAKDVIGPFEKSVDYASEFEFRLAYFNFPTNNELVAIGSIAQYSDIIPMVQIPEYIERVFTAVPAL